MKTTKLVLMFCAVALFALDKANIYGQHSAHDATHSMETFTNPLLPSGPDPWSIWHEDRYYYMHTTGKRLMLWETKDITDLRNPIRKEVIWEPDDTTAIYSQHVWAPEIHRIDNKWYIYFAADSGNTDDHQMFVIENANEDPFEGQWEMKGRISTDPDNNWAIDGSLFEHNGDWYMVWSGWQTRRVDTETQCIYIARMENPWTLGSERILISKPEFEWERHHLNHDGSKRKHIIYVNEGPQPLFSPTGKYIHVAYSASGTWTPYYCLGLLTARADSDLLDQASWSKWREPVFQQSAENGVYTTGHNSFFKSPDGTQDYILYHGCDTPQAKIRSPRAQRIEWNRNDYPVLGIPVPKGVELPKPSGTNSTEK